MELRKWVGVRGRREVKGGLFLDGEMIVVFLYMRMILRLGRNR